MPSLERVVFVALLAVIALLVQEFIARRRHAARLRAGFGSRLEGARHLEAIADYHENWARPAERALDPRTATDLHLDDVFLAIDHTRSAIGRQRLYHRLRVPDVSAFRDADHQLATRFTNEPALRLRAEVALARLADSAAFGLWRLARPNAIPTEPWFIVFPLITIGVVVSAAMIPLWPRALLVLVGLLVANLFVRAATGWRVAGVLAPLRQLGPLLKAAEELMAVPAVAEAAGPRLDRADLKQLRGLRPVARWIGRDPSAQGEVLAMLTEYFNLILLLDANALYFAARELRGREPALVRLLEGVGDIDVVLAVASLRASVPWTRPEFVPSGPLELADGRHPLVDDAVPNSITMPPGSGMILTGANMSGKTTFVRMVGVSVVMAQSLDTCLAAGYRAPVVDIRSCIGRADDLLAGKSYYQVEVDAVLELVHASASETPYLFLFDELFRGTNTVERLAAGQAVLEELLPGPASPHFVIAATHDGELVDLLAHRYQACHFAGSIEGRQLNFDYRLLPGASGERNAIALLELAGAPPALVERARHRASLLDPGRE